MIWLATDEMTPSSATGSNSWCIEGDLSPGCRPLPGFPCSLQRSGEKVRALGCHEHLHLLCLGLGPSLLVCSRDRLLKVEHAAAIGQSSATVQLT